MVLAGVLRIELRHYDLESHALTVTLHPNIRQDAFTSIEGANQNSSDYICKYFAVCVFNILNIIYIFLKQTSRHFNIFVKKMARIIKYFC